jgi:hypothetical protein
LAERGSSTSIDHHIVPVLCETILHDAQIARLA